MKNFDKTIVMFYRGKCSSNKVSSATKMALDKDNLGKYISFEVINLDKRGYEKYLSKLDKLPDVLYVWEDEEIIIDNILEKYPSIELRIFSMNNSTEYKGDYPWGKYIYILAKNIINEYKESQGTITLWTKENNIPKHVTLYSCDYDNFDNWTKRRYFLTEAEAKRV